jgi:putative hydrolase of the HAD superfamily
VISTVTFDFWETLVKDSPENLHAQRALRVGALRAALAGVGSPLAVEEVEGAYDRSLTVLQERFWSRHRDPTYREQVRLVLDCAVPGVADRLADDMLEAAVTAYISPVLSFPPALQSGAAEAVRGLAARGLTLGIISNTGRTPGIMLRRLLEAHDLLRHFSVISYSDEVGYRKPDPEIFRQTLARTGATPSQAAHVGDNPVDDVAGARGAGMRAIHYAAAGRPGADHADLVVTDLAELPERLNGFF